MRIEKLVNTLKKEYYKAKILQASLDATILFFMLYLVSVILNITNLLGYNILYFIAGIALIFLTLDSFYRFRNYEIELYEEHNPELDEMLRTARDNIEENSIVSEALFNDVIERTRSISPATVISGEAIIIKTTFILILSLGTVFTGVMDFSLTEDGTELVNQLTEEEYENQTETVNFEEVDTGDPDDLLGEPEDIDPSEHDFNFDHNIQDGGIYRESRSFETDDNFISTFDSSAELEDRELARRYMVEIRELQSSN